jgi:hypothetical protein
VDIWSPHGFILNEDPSQGWGSGIPPAKNAAVAAEYLSLATKTNLDWVYNFPMFADRVTAFRNWMNTNGERNKPMWVTEFGNMIPPYTAPGQNYTTVPFSTTIDYLQKTFDWLYLTKDATIGDPNDGNRLAQKWFWYSLNDLVSHFGGTLIDPITRIDTPVGVAYRDYNPPADPTVVVPAANLVPEAVTVRAVSRNPSDRSLVNYIITVRVRNHQVSDFLAHGTVSFLEVANLIAARRHRLLAAGVTV